MMKTVILKTSALVCALLVLAISFTTTSCKKDGACHGKITVVDTAGAPVAGAYVVLSAPSVNGQKEYSNATDASGVTLIDLKYPAIMDISATSSKYPGMVGKGILRVDEPGKSEDVTVTIKP